LAINNLQSNLLKQHWAPFSNLSGTISQHKKVIEKCEISFDSTLTRARKPMTRGDSTVLVTRV